MSNGGIEAWTHTKFSDVPNEVSSYDDDELKPSSSGKAARFMRRSELVQFDLFDLTKNEPIRAGGLPVYNDGRFVRLETSENHNLIIGHTGGGKSEAIGRPMMKSWRAAGESVIAVDVKGELTRKEYHGFALDPRYNVRVLDLRDQMRGNRWNMDHLAEFYFDQGDISKERTILRQNSQAMAQKCDKEPYWEFAPVSVNTGMNILEVEDPDRTAPASMIHAYHKLREKAGSVEDGKEYAEELRANNVDPCVLSQISHITNNAESTSRCVWSGLASSIDPFEFSPAAIDQLMMENEIDITSIGEKPTALFIIIPDDSSIMAPVCSMLLNQTYSHLCDVCSKRSDGMLPVRVNFFLDEAGIIKVTELPSKLSAARSRNMRFSVIVQSTEQLESLYGEKDAFSIISNCQNKVWLGGYSRYMNDLIDLAGQDEDGKPLLSKYDMTHLKKGEEALFFLGELPVLAGKIRGAYACDYYKNWSEDYIPPIREPSKIIDTVVASDETPCTKGKELFPEDVEDFCSVNDDSEVQYVIGPQFSMRDGEYLRKAFLSLISDPLNRLIEEERMSVRKISHICEFCYLMKQSMPMDEFGRILRKACKEGESIPLISLLEGPDPMRLKYVSENLMRDFEGFFDLEG